MQDRYLFRGKRIDNGEWVHGYLFDDGFENGRVFIGGIVIEKYNGTACDDWNVNLMQRGYDLKRLLEMMEKHKQYCQIGTVEECREAVEKQTAKKPTLIDYKKYANFVDNAHFLRDAYWCPNCKRVVRSGSFCDGCGQKLDWRANDENTD